MQVGEQPLGTARRHLPGAVADVGVEHGPDPRPVRRDEPVVRRAQLSGDRAQPRRRLLGERGDRRGRVLAEHAPQAEPHLGRRCPPQRGQVVVDGRARAARSGDEELRPVRAVAHDQRPRVREVERTPGELVRRPAQPAQVDRVAVAITELLQGGHGLRQRRDREPGRRQLGHAEIDRQSHVPIM
ncbi:hypothetical protein ACFQQB_18130 [Nonomuraea rubra]|uniref:hypothetical protein n=1 Tax=Nonomuraea rubra TaxID=46180 RepID=UPI0036115FE1